MTQYASLTPELFRAQAREWIEANFPPSLKGQAMISIAKEEKPTPDYLLWTKRMGEIGWSAPTWPAEYGGGGLSETQAEVLTDELQRAGAFYPVGGLGMMMLGPTVLEFGTHEQKLRHIPPIIQDKLRWCQGFSEPGAGSDLASLQTRCEDKGDHWLVNGQKIWTSFADLADWCFCLVRTDTSRKQGGISFLLIDMKTPGVEVRPIKLINGISHFCETFLTDVKVPKENLLGEVNQGWTIAKRLLQHERNGLSAQRAASPPPTQDLAALARHYVGMDQSGRLADGDLRTRLVDHLMMDRALKLTMKRRASEQEAGLVPTTAVSTLKNVAAAIAQERGELAVEILGNRSLGWDGPGYDERELGFVSEWLYSKCFSIYGGSHEVQNNITAKHVLNLPD